jgi:tetratricopeptide (TPR) repeat protein
MNLGDAYFWLRNRPDQARDAYRQALRLGHQTALERTQRGSTPDAMIAARLSTVFPKLDAPDSARVMLQEALALDSLNSRVQYQAALTLWQLGDHDSAIRWLQRSIAGGFPAVWVRDSPVHRDWRQDPEFQALIASSNPAGNTPSPGKGERK